MVLARKSYRDDGLSPFAGRVRTCLSERLSPIIAGAMLRSVCERCGKELRTLDASCLPPLMGSLESGLAYYLEPGDVESVLASLRDLVGKEGAARPATTRLQATLEIQSDADIHRARTQAAALSRDVGLSSFDAIKIATAVSELSRNVVQYAGLGTVKLQQVEGRRRGLRVVVSDSGPGIPHLDEVLEGEYRSRTGRGRGIRGSQAVMDVFDVDSVPGRGTVVTCVKYAD